MRSQPPTPHPVKAMLDYAHGVLEGQVRIATISGGLAPRQRL
ncbi:MAG TPA: hypothetical protein VFR69_10390 [Rubrobacteraceae bacterium]|nr:hypothetical protein [Rubrobacteraceae bacterium]